jgi:hypothetical protein
MLCKYVAALRTLHIKRGLLRYFPAYSGRENEVFLQPHYFHRVLWLFHLRKTY